MFKVDQKLGAKDNVSVRALEALGDFQQSLLRQPARHLRRHHRERPGSLRRFRDARLHPDVDQRIPHGPYPHHRRRSQRSRRDQLGREATASRAQPPIPTSPPSPSSASPVTKPSATAPPTRSVTSSTISIGTMWSPGTRAATPSASAATCSTCSTISPPIPTSTAPSPSAARTATTVSPIFCSAITSSTSRKIGTVTNHIYSTNYGAFIQDDYKIHPNLTLNLGLRYELQSMPYEKYGQMSNYVPSHRKVILASAITVPNLDATVAGAGLTGLVGLAADYGIPKSLVQQQLRQLRAAHRLRLASLRQQPHRGAQRLWHLLHRQPAQRDAHRSHRRLPILALAILHRLHQQSRPPDARQPVPRLTCQALGRHHL